VSRLIDILRRRNDDLSDRDDVEFKRNGGYEFGGYSRSNRGRNGAARALYRRDTLTISGHRRTGAKIDAWSCGVAEGLRNGPKIVLGTAEALCGPQASDTPRHPCSTKREYSGGSRQGQ
jgi:hypothetical protein